MRASPLPPSILLLLSFAALALAACGGDDKPPPKVAHETADAQIKRVGVRWSDSVEDRGFLENDPNGVLQFKVTTTRTFVLGEGAKVSLHVDRDETFETKLGHFHCTARGDLTGAAAYSWAAGEAEIRIDLPEATLPRHCEQPAFPVTAKSLPASTTLLVLRSDRLIGKTSARDRTVLLPLP